MTLSLTHWLSQTFDFSYNDFNDYNDYYDYNGYNDYNDYNDYRDSNLDLDWERYSE